MSLASKYLIAIHACAREHGVTREQLHESIAYVKKTSLKDLTPKEAVQLLDGMRRAGRSYSKRIAMATHGRRGEAKPRRTEFLVTASELNLLLKECAKRRWTAETLQAFTGRQLGGADKKIRTTAEFNKVYWALKRMNERDPIAVCTLPANETSN